jgi:hypothetical protein
MRVRERQRRRRHQVQQGDDHKAAADHAGSRTDRDHRASYTKGERHVPDPPAALQA